MKYKVRLFTVDIKQSGVGVHIKRKYGQIEGNEGVFFIAFLDVMQLRREIFPDKPLGAGDEDVHLFPHPFSSSCIYSKANNLSFTSSTVNRVVLLELNSRNGLRVTSPLSKNLS